jgi:hypothetical protein
MGAEIAPRPCIRWAVEVHNHNAAMRIDGEAPGSETTLWNGRSQVPPRYTATSDCDRIRLTERPTPMFCNFAIRAVIWNGD